MLRSVKARENWLCTFLSEIGNNVRLQHANLSPSTLPSAPWKKRSRETSDNKSWQRTLKKKKSRGNKGLSSPSIASNSVTDRWSLQDGSRLQNLEQLTLQSLILTQPPHPSPSLPSVFTLPITDAWQTESRKLHPASWGWDMQGRCTHSCLVSTYSLRSNGSYFS